MHRGLLILWLALSLAGCTTLQVAQGNKLPNVISSLKEGDKVTVTTYSGTVTTLAISSINGRAITGTNDGTQTSIPIAQIKSIAKTTYSPGKTIGLVAGVLGGIFAALAIIGLHAIGNANK